jgi:CRP-like cAMP-binding protein
MSGKLLTWEQRRERTEQLHPLLRLIYGTPVKFSKGEALFLEGDPPQWLFLIRQGKVVLSKSLPNGNKTILSVRVAGDMVGEVAVFDGKPYDTDAIALTEVSAFRFQRSAFLNALRMNPHLAEQIIA